MLLDFVARKFRGMVNGILKFILICFAIGGFVAGGTFFGGAGYAFLGLLVGGLLGLNTVIISGGLIANFLNMVDNIETIKYHLSETGNTSNGSTSELNLSNVPPINPTVINSGDS
jgi:hypothetical protein